MSLGEYIDGYIMLWPLLLPLPPALLARGSATMPLLAQQTLQNVKQNYFSIYVAFSGTTRSSVTHLGQKGTLDSSRDSVF